MADRFYTENEAQEILRLATSRSASNGGMSRERLIEAAAEMGIDPTDIIAAEQDILARQAKADLRRRYAEATKREFLGGASHLVGISVLLFGINFLTMGGFHGIWSTWAIWPCGFMAINVLKEGWEYFASRTALGDGEFEKWCERQLEKDAKSQMKEWTKTHPGQDYALIAARQAYAENPDAKLNAIKQLREKTGLGLKDAKDLIESLEREVRHGNLQRAAPAASTYEVARQALSEVGPERKYEAIDLVRARTGLGMREADEAVSAVLELSH
jgi:ribosomal protein L7/L12